MPYNDIASLGDSISLGLGAYPHPPTALHWDTPQHAWYWMLWQGAMPTGLWWAYGAGGVSAIQSGGLVDLLCANPHDCVLIEYTIDNEYLQNTTIASYLSSISAIRAQIHAAMPAGTRIIMWPPPPMGTPNRTTPNAIGLLPSDYVTAVHNQATTNGWEYFDAVAAYTNACTAAGVTIDSTLNPYDLIHPEDLGNRFERDYWAAELGLTLTRITSWVSATGALSPQPPGIPGVAVLARDLTTMTVAITPPQSNGGSPIEGMQITAQPGGQQATFAGAAGGTYTFTGLDLYTDYVFTGVAWNAVGAGVASAAVGPPASSSVWPTVGEISDWATKINMGLAVNHNGDGTLKTRPWTAYSASVVPGAGAFTNAWGNGRYLKMGKTIFFDVSISITDPGTAAGPLGFTLPEGLLAASNVTFMGRELATTGRQALISAALGSNLVQVGAYVDGTSLIAPGVLVSFSGVLEVF